MSSEFLYYEPSYYADLSANLGDYKNAKIGGVENFARDSCYETKLEKEYLCLEKQNFHERAK